MCCYNKINTPSWVTYKPRLCLPALDPTNPMSRHHQVPYLVRASLLPLCLAAGMSRRDIPCLPTVRGTGINNFKYLTRSLRFILTYNLKETHSIMAAGRKGMTAKTGGIVFAVRKQIENRKWGYMIRTLGPPPGPTSSSETPPLKGSTTFPNSTTDWEPSV